MPLLDFVNSNLNKQLDNGQGSYKGECVSLSIRVAHDVYGVPYGTMYCVERYINGRLDPNATGGAIELFRHFGETNMPRYFDLIPNNPNDYNQLPQPGDFIVWGTSMGHYGHVAVVVSANPLRVFQQLGTPVFKPSEIRQYANYNGVLGWLRPKQAAQPNAPQGGDMVTTKEQLDRMYVALLHRPRGAGEGEDVYLGKDSGWVFEDIYRAKERGQRLQTESDQFASLNSTLNQLQAAVNEMSTNPTKAQYAEAMDKVTQLTRDLEEANKKLQEVPIPAPTDGTALDNYSLGELLSAAFKKTFKIK